MRLFEADRLDCKTKTCNNLTIMIIAINADFQNGGQVYKVPALSSSIGYIVILTAL